MDWGALVNVALSKLFTVLSWPSFVVFCPLYASFRALESNSSSKNRQCLAFWVLFALTTILEQSIGKLLLWIPFWPQIKGIATVLSVIPYFAGASYMYMNLVRPYLWENLCSWDVMEEECFSFGQQSKFVDAAEVDGIEVGMEECEKSVIYQGNFESCYYCKGEEQVCPASSRKVQKDWSCFHCMVTTSSEKCLEKHFMGKKHKLNEEKLRDDKYNSFTGMNRNDGLGFLSNLVNIEIWDGLLNPASASIRWCKWEKPDFGWIKLNTDGSVDQGNASFGGLLRDSKGKALCAFISKSPCNDIFSVELLAIWRGLVLALSLGIKVIWIESDSMSAVKTINRKQSHRGKADGCLERIWQLLNKFQKYQVSHSFREANRAADYLSKMVLNGSDIVLSPVDFPNSLWKIIKDDAQGRLYRRKMRPG